MPIHEKTLSVRTLPSIRQLRAFVAVYYTGQVSAAAEQLSLTQPAVTVLLRELEAKLGVKLFDRSTRSIRRTEAAAEAIVHAERALAELEAMGASMAELAGARRGRVRVATTSTIAQTWLPSTLRRFLGLHPGVHVVVEDVGPAAFVETVLSDRVDFGIGTLEAPVSGLVEEVIVRDYLAAVGPRTEEFGDAPMRWKQLGSLPLITVRSGYGIRRRIDAAAAEAGVALRIEHEASLLTTAVAMAAAGLGVAVVPSTLLQYLPHPGLVARKLTRPVVERHTALIYRLDRSLPPAAQALAKALASP